VIEGIGIDIVEKVRFEEICSQGFVEKYFSNEEKYLSVEKLASRFAAKEAFFKALNNPLMFRWEDVEVTSSVNGAPEFRFHNNLFQFMEKKRTHLSISYSNDNVLAVVIIVEN
jgi:holo-[acyl-carrier protein] synthase